MQFLDLPEELILTVISWLPLTGVLGMRLVCREVNRVCDDSSLWRGRFIKLGECINQDSTDAPRNDEHEEQQPRDDDDEEDGDNGGDFQHGDLDNTAGAQQQLTPTAQNETVVDGEVTRPKMVYPSERLWCSAVVYRDWLFIYGGHTTKGLSNLISNVKSDMFVYDFRRKTWSEIPHEIGGKTEHKCVVYGDALWFVGGYNGHNYTNDVRRYDPHTGTSAVVDTTGVSFSPRSALTAVVHQNKMYTFGGWNGFTKQWYNDLHVFNFDTKEWREVNCKGECPSQRTSHACVVWNNRMYVFAGFSGDQYLNDLHEFDFETETWREITMETQGTRPSPRSRFCAVVHGDSMYLLGGWNKVTYFDDFYSYNFLTKTWTQISNPYFNIPSLSQYSLTAYDNKLYIFGGFCSQAKECVNRLYVYQLPKEEQPDCEMQDAHERKSSDRREEFLTLHRANIASE